MTILTTSHVKWPASIAIDNTLQRLYWTDLSKRHICSCDLDGANVKVIIKDLSSPYALTVFEEYVYWTDFTEQRLYKANKFSGNRQENFKETFLAPMDINVFHPLSQKEGM